MDARNGTCMVLSVDERVADIKRTGRELRWRAKWKMRPARFDGLEFKNGSRVALIVPLLAQPERRPPRWLAWENLPFFTPVFYWPAFAISLTFSISFMFYFSLIFSLLWKCQGERWMGLMDIVEIPFISLSFFVSSSPWWKCLFRFYLGIEREKMRGWMYNRNI